MLSTIFLASLLLWSSSSASDRQGWHGEVMPEGLEKGTQEGEYLWEKDNSVMVYIPPGPFTMGTDSGTVNERPAHEVYLDGYYIDKYEVSWRQWKLSGLPFSDHQFARRPYPEAPDWGIRDNFPVMSVSFH